MRTALDSGQGQVGEDLKISRVLSILAAVLWFAGQAATASAQPADAASDGRSGLLRTILPAEFEAYSPVTARDAIDRVPGLDIVGGGDQRGLGAGGNVLINGERVGGKSNTALDQLSRFSASKIIRIDVYAAGTDAFDAGGSSQIIDVIIDNNDGGISGTYRGQMAYVPRSSDLWGDIGFSLNRTTQRLTLDFGFETDGFQNPNRAPETFGLLGAQVPDITRVETRRYEYRDYEFTSALAYKLTDAQTLRLTGRGEFYDERSFEVTADQTSLTPPLVTTRLDYGGEGQEAEFTGEYEAALSGGKTFKLTSFYSFGIFTEGTGIRTFEDGVATALDLVGTESDQREMIVRTRTVWPLAKRNLLTFQLEGARNTLDADLFLDTAAGSAPRPEIRILANLASSTRVAELRGDGFVEHQWTISKPWVLTTRLAAEVSQIEVSGASESQRTFVFPKPQVTLTYQINPSNRLEFGVERVIGQLDFFDFAAQVALDDNEQQGSTGELRPQREWRNDVTWERQFPKKSGRTSLVLFYDLLQDVIEPVPVSETIDAIGNIGNARRFGVEAEFSLRLGPFGLPDILLEGELAVSSSRITDPLSGQNRRIERFRALRYNLSFRHDISRHKLSYGTDVEFEGRQRRFEINQIIETRDSPELNVFVESQRVKGLVMRVTGANLLNRRFARTRSIFTPNRLLDSAPFAEDRARTRGREVRLELEGVF